MANDLLLEMVGAVYLFLPAYLANMMPVFAARLKILQRLRYPIDTGLRWHGQELFGKNKTVRGFVVGSSGAFAVGVLQYLFASEMAFLSVVDYSSLAFTLVLAILLGLGALVGDCVKSFFKRQLGKKPSTSWLGADQIDYALGGVLFMLILVRPSLTVLLTILIFSPLASALANLVGYWFNVKKVWW